jgi:hypothetical protein
VRLLNWLGKELPRVLGRLAVLSNRNVLVSVTTTKGPEQVKSTGAVIPNECDVLACFAGAGLVVAERRSSEHKGGHMANVVLLWKR